MTTAGSYPSWARNRRRSIGTTYGPRVADVDPRVDRRAARVDPHLRRVAGHELRELAAERVPDPDLAHGCDAIPRNGRDRRRPRSASRSPPRSKLSTTATSTGCSQRRRHCLLPQLAGATRRRADGDHLGGRRGRCERRGVPGRARGQAAIRRARRSMIAAMAEPVIGEQAKRNGSSGHADGNGAGPDAILGPLAAAARAGTGGVARRDRRRRRRRNPVRRQARGRRGPPGAGGADRRPRRPRPGLHPREPAPGSGSGRRSGTGPRSATWATSPRTARCCWSATTPAAT